MALSGMPMFRHSGIWATDEVRRGQREALAGVAQWIEHSPANQKITGSIPSQGTCLGCRYGPW